MGWGLGFGVWALGSPERLDPSGLFSGFRVQDFGFGVWDLGFGVVVGGSLLCREMNLGVGVWSAGFTIEDFVLSGYARL